MNDAEEDVNKQILQCQTLLVKGVDAIILDEMDSEWCSTIVEKCKEDGVPFVECNTLTSNTDYTCYVGSDDVDSGLIQAKFLKTVLPDDAKICILYEDPWDNLHRYSGEEDISRAE